MTINTTSEVNMTIKGYQKSVKTKNTYHFELYSKTDDTRTYLINKDFDLFLNFNESEYYKIKNRFENFLFPLKIEVDYKGNFVKIVDKENWIAQWEEKSNLVVEKAKNQKKALDIKAEFLEAINDDNYFPDVKMKEGFWNLFLFNPQLDDVNNEDLGTNINWHVKNLNLINFKGRTTLRTSYTTNNIEIVFSNSNLELEPEMIDLIRNRFNLEETVPIKNEIKFDYISIFDPQNKKLKSKKALIDIHVTNLLHYNEEILIEASY